MNSKERMLIALNRGIPDKMPVTIHQWQSYHLNTYMNGATEIEAFKKMGLDASATYYPSYYKSPRVDWIETSTVRHQDDITITDYLVSTPDGKLTYQISSNKFTSWYSENLIKDYDDIYIYKKHFPKMAIKRKELEEHYSLLGDSGIARCGIPSFQGGCYQAAQVLYGVERLIYDCYDNPDWVHEFLNILLERKLEYIEDQLRYAKVDLVETGGGGSSDTVISPGFHKEFCEPYDKKIHDAIHRIGLPVVYHTCGGMMNIMDSILDNGCDASETLSPPEIGGNIVDGTIVKGKLGPKIALIGGMDQITLLTNGSPEQIKKEVKRLFEIYGKNGGYIMSACDHFFEVPVGNLKAYVEAARECIY